MFTYNFHFVVQKDNYHNIDIIWCVVSATAENVYFPCHIKIPRISKMSTFHKLRTLVLLEFSETALDFKQSVMCYLA